ncbi:hypothetical protein QBC40DRAFT_344973 [Triangularia verruculosa]|uniref:Uncharacterized protein n=1 Tax=Triangularia verruculosa TaxID=2587418 RepID=A0AAN7AZW4_9PEZI|nr:hypothetical protein QBC40DRAFT_344973 [Triangularia verruculosa]
MEAEHHPRRPWFRRKSRNSSSQEQPQPRPALINLHGNHEPSDHSLDIIVVPDLTGAGPSWAPTGAWDVNVNARVFILKYHVADDPEITDILSQRHLNTLAEDFQDLVLEQKRPDIPIILVGCGYGGVLCEIALLDSQGENATPAPDPTEGGKAKGKEPEGSKETSHTASLLNRTSRVVLVGTPHFQTGIAQWATYSVKGKKKGRPLTAWLDHWSKEEKMNVEGISEMQRQFRDTFTQHAGDHGAENLRHAFIHLESKTSVTDLKVTCCYTDPTSSAKDSSKFEGSSPISPRSRQSQRSRAVIDPMWAILPRAYLVGVAAGYQEMVEYFLLRGGPSNGPVAEGGDKLKEITQLLKECKFVSGIVLETEGSQEKDKGKELADENHDERLIKDDENQSRDQKQQGQ